MPILHLGVIDQPYSVQRTKGRRKATASTKTTGDVAQWLEDEYHIMEHFAELHRDDITKSIDNAIAGSMETMMMGGPAELSLDSAVSEIATMMKDMITNQELDRLGFPGIPTQAALRGVNHRMAHPYARRPARPSFRDTGLFQASMTAWFDK